MRQNTLGSLFFLLTIVLNAGAAGAFENLASNFAFSNLQRELLDRRTGQNGSAGVTAPDAQAVVSFTPSPAQTQANLRAFIDRTSAPEAKAELRRIVEQQPNIMTDIGQAMRSRYGLDPHNVADAFAVWWITTWLTASKRTDLPDGPTISAVREQVYTAFQSTPDLAKASNADRQEYTEALLMQTLLMSELSQAATGNPALQEQLAAQALRAAQNNGLALGLMRLTPNGFEMR